MAVGNWKINVNTSGMPEKVATAFDQLGVVMVGADYDFIAYLGTQLVNGVNHAVLAEQTITTGRDVKNIVVLVFNEKPGDIEVTLVGIDRVVESGGMLGGTAVNVKTELGEAEMDVWHDAFEGYVGANVRPFALLGTQLANGVNYIFGAELEPMTLEGENEAVLVIVNDVTRKVAMSDLLKNKHEASLGYAFTW